MLKSLKSFRFNKNQFGEQNLHCLRNFFERINRQIDFSQAAQRLIVMKI